MKRMFVDRIGEKCSNVNGLLVYILILLSEMNSINFVWCCVQIHCCISIVIYWEPQASRNISLSHESWQQLYGV